jgi:uroporphyrinogen-III decarboxylase
LNTVERFKAVFLGEAVDRVPVCAWLGLPYLQSITGQSPRSLIEGVIGDPSQIIEVQENLGLDPIIITMSERWFSSHRFWRLLYDWPDEALETWQVEETSDTRHGSTDYCFVANTPAGALRWSYRVSAGQISELEPPIKREQDLELLKYMPRPDAANQATLIELVRQVGNRAFFTHNVAGIWGEAVGMRGLAQLLMDLYDRPTFVTRLSEFLMERCISRVQHLAKTGVHSILYDQTWVGVGISPKTYRQFILPYDVRVVNAAKEAGLLVSYHNCGRGMQFLDDMVSSGAHSLETLTPRSSSGDFDLQEVKRRVGGQITLNGGFDERVLAAGTTWQVGEETKRCLNAAACDGRYVLRTCGQIFAASQRNIETFAATGREMGRY